MNGSGRIDRDRKTTRAAAETSRTGFGLGLARFQPCCASPATPSRHRRPELLHRLGRPDETGPPSSTPGGDLELLATVAAARPAARADLAHPHPAGGTGDALAPQTAACRSSVGPRRPVLDRRPAAAEQDVRLPRGRGPSPTRWLEDSDTVTLGAHTLDVRHCPGHARPCRLPQPGCARLRRRRAVRRRHRAPTSPAATTRR